MASSALRRRAFPRSSSITAGRVDGPSTRSWSTHFAAYRVSWVALAGFMRIITPVFLDAFPGRVINIHPSLLPAFPGVNAQQQAYDAGVAVTGATVHFVDAGMDTGPVIAQGVVPRRDDDAVEDLKARILTMEHRLFPMVMRLAAEGRLALRDGEVEADLLPGESLRLDH